MQQTLIPKIVLGVALLCLGLVFLVAGLSVRCLGITPVYPGGQGGMYCYTLFGGLPQPFVAFLLPIGFITLLIGIAVLTHLILGQARNNDDRHSS